MKKNAALALVTSIIVIMTTVCFAYNSAILDQKATQELDKVAAKLDLLSDYSIELSGHTDFIGNEDYNNQLSEKRAIAVRDYLISKNVDSTKISISFYGERKPLVPNTTEENFALNRRVEVEVLVPVPEVKDELQFIETPPTITEPKELEIKTNDDSLQRSTVKKKKARRRLVWTGWRHGFHWSTSGR